LTTFGDKIRCGLGVTPTEKITVVDYFAPDNLSSLNASDEDLGGAGAMLVPGSTAVMGGGKQGILCVLNTNNLDHFFAGNTNAQQVLPLNADEIKGSRDLRAYDATNNLVELWDSEAESAAIPREAGPSSFLQSR